MSEASANAVSEKQQTKKEWETVIQKEQSNRNRENKRKMK